MIALRPMTSGEFAGYLACLLPDYAAEIAANYVLPLDQARARAEREIASDLPQGTDTEGDSLLVISQSADAVCVGYVWYRLDAMALSAFIYDFQILPEHQGKGLGARAQCARRAAFCGGRW